MFSCAYDVSVDSCCGPNASLHVYIRLHFLSFFALPLQFAFTFPHADVGQIK